MTSWNSSNCDEDLTLYLACCTCQGFLVKGLFNLVHKQVGTEDSLGNKSTCWNTSLKHNICRYSSQWIPALFSTKLPNPATMYRKTNIEIRKNNVFAFVMFRIIALFCLQPRIMQVAWKLMYKWLCAKDIHVLQQLGLDRSAFLVKVYPKTDITLRT